MAWYYTFEAKEIQGFILQSDKLREMVGGSELVSRLCGKFLHDALKAVGVGNPEKAIIANAAGWARIRFDDESQAREFAEAWPMVVSRYAPGLKLIQALLPIDGTLPEAVRKGIQILRGERNLNEAVLPETGPLIERNPRTGAAAVKLQTDSRSGKPVPMDQQTIRKRDISKNHSSLTGKISSQFGHDDWPYEIEEIASRKSSYIAVIHADGNDLGSTLMRISEHLEKSPDEADAIYRELTEVIDDITVSAVREASENILFPEFLEKKAAGKKDVKIAARPIVLGGDDLTIIVRSDLAIDFTNSFLEAFEKLSLQKLASLRKRIKGFPEVLTACAGIAFVKKSYPFSSAYHMAESLCEHTKKAAKADRDKRKSADGHVAVPSSFSWHRITTSMAESFTEIRKQELTGRGLYEAKDDNGNKIRKPVQFCFGPYAVGNCAGNIPPLDKLLDLRKAVQSLPGGSIRTLISTLHTDPVTALKDYARILEVAEEPQSAAFSKALANLTGNSESRGLWDKEMKTPLADAHLLAEIMKGGEYVQG